MISNRSSKTFPGFSRIHVLEEPGNSTAFRGDISFDEGAPLSVTRAEKNPAGTVLRWKMGRKKPTDVIRATVVAPVIIADRVVKLLNEYGFQGWEAYKVRVMGKTGEEFPGYSGLAVHGRCGPIDDSLSVKIDRIRPGGIFPAWKGLYFDPFTWDGSDLFMAANKFGGIFLTEEVREAFEKAKVRNVAFTSLQDYERIVL